MAVKKILFIEGEPLSPNGDLRQGMSKLLSQLLFKNLPKMILGGGKTITIDKFKNNKLKADRFLLLIDLDKPETEIANDIKEYNLTTHKEDVFYMIQEMESWFLSQPEILDSFYGKDLNHKLISEKMIKKNAQDFSNPDEELKKLTRNTKRGEYHKIKHAIELLKLLDAKKLQIEFSQFKNLIKRLN
jgi:Domain of unknown function (DUF4276)